MQPLTRLLQRGLDVARDGRGAALIELAFVMPMLILLLGGGVETVNYVLVNHKVERTSATLSDLVSQSPRMTEGLMISLFQAADRVMHPLDLDAEGTVIVSSIGVTSNNPPRINWQRSTGGGHDASRFGTQGAAASLPAGLTLADGDSIIVCEAYFHYQPMLYKGVIEDSTLYRFAVFRPRFSKLDVIYP